MATSNKQTPPIYKRKGFRLGMMAAAIMLAVVIGSGIAGMLSRGETPGGQTASQVVDVIETISNVGTEIQEIPAAAIEDIGAMASVETVGATSSVPPLSLLLTNKDCNMASGSNGYEVFRMGVYHLNENHGSGCTFHIKAAMSQAQGYNTAGM